MSDTEKSLYRLGRDAGVVVLEEVGQVLVIDGGEEQQQNGLVLSVGVLLQHFPLPFFQVHVHVLVVFVPEYLAHHHHEGLEFFHLFLGELFPVLFEVQQVAGGVGVQFHEHQVEFVLRRERQENATGFHELEFFHLLVITLLDALVQSHEVFFDAFESLFGSRDPTLVQESLL